VHTQREELTACRGVVLHHDKLQQAIAQLLSHLTVYWISDTVDLLVRIASEIEQLLTIVSGIEGVPVS
jgi:hypothetical protein